MNDITNLNTHTHTASTSQSSQEDFILDDNDFSEDDYLKWVEMVDTCLGEL